MGTGRKDRSQRFEPMPPKEVGSAALAVWVAGRWTRSFLEGQRLGHRLEDVETYAMFVGYPRSGHSLVGSLLNAHPDALIAHELDALWFVRAHFSRRQLMAMLLDRDREALALDGFPGRYDYSVPGQWQGHVRRLRVIGDKKGGGSTKRLGQDPRLLERLRSRVGLPLRMIHVMRDPFDNIATMYRRKGQRTGMTLDRVARRYLDLAETNRDLASSARPGEWISVRHEDFVADPEAELARLCDFVGLEADESYLRACAGIVNDRPRRSSEDEDWPPGLIAEIRDRAAALPFLASYLEHGVAMD